MLVYQRVNSIPLNHLTSYPPFASMISNHSFKSIIFPLRPSFIWGFYQKILNHPTHPFGWFFSCRSPSSYKSAYSAFSITCFDDFPATKISIETSIETFPLIDFPATGHPRSSPRNLSWLPGAEALRHSPWSWDLCRSLRSAAAAPPPSARAVQPGARRSCRPGWMGWVEGWLGAVDVENLWEIHGKSRKFYQRNSGWSFDGEYAFL